MDQILDIQLILNGNELIVVDHTTLPANLSDWNMFEGVSILTYNDSDEIHRLIYSETPQQELRINLERDGKYYYYKMYIPVLEYFTDNPELDPHNLVGEIFLYNSKLYKVISAPDSVRIDAILAHSVEVGPLGAYKSIMDGTTDESLFFPKKSIFNVCNLRKCLVYLQRKMLLEACETSCQKSQDLRNKRDFLLSAAYVIEYLKETENYEEAQRILDNLSSCGFLCEDNVITHNNCGCEHTI